MLLKYMTKPSFNSNACFRNLKLDHLCENVAKSGFNFLGSGCRPLIEIEIAVVSGIFIMFLFQCRTFPNNYWDKFVKRKVRFQLSFKMSVKYQGHLFFCREMISVCYFQVLDKYGDIYGRERIAELLGMDLASLDVSAMTHEKKPEPDTSMFSWYVLDSTLFT